MNREFNDELISAYLDGELTAEEQALVEQQLMDSVEHRKMFEELRALRGSLQSLPSLRLDDDFHRRVLKRAERTMLSSAGDETGNHTGGSASDGAAPSQPANGDSRTPASSKPGVSVDGVGSADGSPAAGAGAEDGKGERRDDSASGPRVESAARMRSWISPTAAIGATLAAVAAAVLVAVMTYPLWPGADVAQNSHSAAKSGMSSADAPAKRKSAAPKAGAAIPPPASVSDEQADADRTAVKRADVGEESAGKPTTRGAKSAEIGDTARPITESLDRLGAKSLSLPQSAKGQPAGGTAPPGLSGQGDGTATARGNRVSGQAAQQGLKQSKEVKLQAEVADDTNGLQVVELWLTRKQYDEKAFDRALARHAIDFVEAQNAAEQSKDVREGLAGGDDAKRELGQLKAAGPAASTFAEPADKAPQQSQKGSPNRPVEVVVVDAGADQIKELLNTLQTVSRTTPTFDDAARPEKPTDEFYGLRAVQLMNRELVEAELNESARLDDATPRQEAAEHLNEQRKTPLAAGFGGFGGGGSGSAGAAAPGAGGTSGLGGDGTPDAKKFKSSSRRAIAPRGRSGAEPSSEKAAADSAKPAEPPKPAKPASSPAPVAPSSDAPVASKPRSPAPVAESKANAKPEAAPQAPPLPAEPGGDGGYKKFDKPNSAAKAEAAAQAIEEDRAALPAPATAANASPAPQRGLATRFSSYELEADLDPLSKKPARFAYARTASAEPAPEAQSPGKGNARDKEGRAESRTAPPATSPKAPLKDSLVKNAPAGEVPSDGSQTNASPNNSLPRQAGPGGSFEGNGSRFRPAEADTDAFRAAGGQQGQTASPDARVVIVIRILPESLSPAAAQQPASSEKSREAQPANPEK